MAKDEFLTALRGRLTGKIPTAEVESNINYYDSYISDELAKGRSEDDIMTELGSPELIAKTLADSSVREAEQAGYGNQYVTSSDSYEYVEEDEQSYQSSSDPSYGRSGSYTGEGANEDRGRKAAKRRGTKAFIISSIIFIIVIVVVFLVMSMVFRVGFYLMRWFLPVIVILILIAVFARRRD